jgi:diguanylate cyclase (GGDEF)-like protein/putative nucleotidyltransferase with HDIG domain
MQPAADDPRHHFGALPRARRPMLLVLVFGVFLVLVGITATALVAITSSNLVQTTVNASVERDASLVELFVNGNLARDDLREGGPGPARSAELSSKLGALTQEDAILRIEVRSPAGEILFGTEPTAVGERLPLSEEMRLAVDAGRPSALLSDSPGRDLAGPVLSASKVIAEYLPIVDEAGETRAVMTMWRDAAPLLAGAERTQRDVVIVVLVAAIVLAAVLFLIFRAAHVRIGRQQTQLVESTRRDALTGMLNHGAVVAALDGAVDRLRGNDGRLAVALLDVDNFTLLNDTYGHAAGDQVLLTVAGILDGEPRIEAGRFGPDEFLLSWLDADVTEASAAVASLRTRLADVAVRFGESESLPVSVSIGIAAYPEHAASVTELLSAATVALQEAKASGGDAVRVAERAEERTSAGSFDVLQGLVIAVDTKDRYTKRHSEDVARYAVFLARRLGLDDEMIATTKLSGLLHDIGKIGIPDALLRKPGKLTAGEFETFKQHVALGDSIVRDLPNLETVRDGIRHHHERWDGKGYLQGLEGDAIPIIGRIMAVADAFSAMTTTRPYRKALPIEEALKRLGDAAGTQLQEELVSTFIAGIETDADAPLPGEQGPSIWLRHEKVA